MFSPDNRILDYCLFAGYVFNFKEITFINNFDKIEDHFSQIFVDQKFIEECISFDFKTKDIQINILLWNGDFDYKKFRLKLDKLKEKFSNIKVFSISNFNSDKHNTIPLNYLNINNENSLKKINGINLIKKVKYLFPIIYSIYNFIRYFIYSKKFIFQKKVVFVGLGDINDTCESLKLQLNSDFSSDDNNKICKMILSDILKNKNFSVQECFNYFDLKLFDSLEIHEKYYLSNILIRFLLIKHLKRFKNFYHKNNSKFPFDLINSNIYNNIIQIDLGSKIGNSYIYPRSLLINRFYKRKNIKINLFHNDENYYENNLFSQRLEKIKKYLFNIYKFEKFSCSAEELSKEIKKLNIHYLN